MSSWTRRGRRCTCEQRDRNKHLDFSLLQSICLYFSLYTIFLIIFIRCCLHLIIFIRRFFGQPQTKMWLLNPNCTKRPEHILKTEYNTLFGPTSNIKHQAHGPNTTRGSSLYSPQDNWVSISISSIVRRAMHGSQYNKIRSIAIWHLEGFAFELTWRILKMFVQCYHQFSLRKSECIERLLKRRINKELATFQFCIRSFINYPFWMDTQTLWDSWKTQD